MFEEPPLKAVTQVSQSSSLEAVFDTEVNETSSPVVIGRKDMIVAEKFNQCSKNDRKCEEKVSQNGKKIVDVESEDSNLKKTDESSEIRIENEKSNLETIDNDCSELRIEIEENNVKKIDEDSSELSHCGKNIGKKGEVTKNTSSDKNEESGRRKLRSDDNEKLKKMNEIKKLNVEAEVFKPKNGVSKVIKSYDSKGRLRTRNDIVTPCSTQKSVTSVPSSVLVELFETIYKSGRPNFRGCRIPLPGSKFNIPLWRELLDDYPDKVVCDFLEFGFPLDFDKSVDLRTDERRNHKGARDHPEFIDQYLRNETKRSRIAGPFKHNPLSRPIMVSPLNTVPKSSVDERRVLVDLSWPLGKGSVNSGISKEFYLEQKIESHYASVEEVCSMVLEIGQGAVIYKRDLRQAYRQFPVDPADFYLLGYHWKEQYYFDTVLAMGQRNAGVGCSRITNALMFIHSKQGHKGGSYLDDLIGVSHPSSGAAAYDQLGKLLHDLGLEENIPKACPPSVIQTVLGVLIDTENMTISVTDERMKEIKHLLGKWEKKKVCRKKELQSLIGKLCFICKCVRQSRIFLNRLLEVLRAVDWEASSRIKLSAEFHKELKWWSMFMSTFNGVAFIPSPIWMEPDVSMATDSCLQGCGGISDDQYFHSEFPLAILEQGLPIHKLEFLAVLVGARIWGSRFSGLKIRIYCDNKPVVDVINSSKTKDAFMATCLRELWLVVSTNKFELRAVHLPGEDNRVADWLSRWHLGKKYQDAFRLFTSGSSYKEILLDSDIFKFSKFL